MHLIITVDTEADNQWKPSEEMTIRNLHALPRFQALCEQYGFPPTYLCSSEVFQDKDVTEQLKMWHHSGVAEVGAHLHPWATEPVSERDRSEKQWFHRFPSELSGKELRAKMKTLTAEVTAGIGDAPKSFRAGRWGFNQHVADVLIEQGYVVDCSVTPKVSWKKTVGDPKGTGGPDFRFAPEKPYEMLHSRGAGSLLEVPMTILFTGMLQKANGICAQIVLRLPGNHLLRRALNGLLLRLTWLRIFPESSSDDWKRIIVAAKKKNLPVIEFMIHSSELMVGGSPYSKNQQQVDHIFEQLESFLKQAKQAEIKGITLSGFAASYST